MKIAVIAGEKSGDNYGVLLIEAIREIEPSVSIIGTGGEGIKARSDIFIEGLPSGQMGFSGVILRLPLFYRAFNNIKETIKKEKPTLIVFIDNPGFNLKLAEALGKKFPCFYYIPPKVWAHNYERIEVIKKYIRTVIAIFPFEQEIYKKEGIPVVWFGHPAVDLVKKEKADTIKTDIPVIGLLPGSRVEEVKSLLPVFLNLIKLISEKRDIKVLLSASDKNIRRQEEKILKKYNFRLDIVEGNPHSVIASSSVVLAASGTVNLEISLLERHQLVLYKTTYINYILGRLMVKLDMVSPVNLILGEKVVPEYIQFFRYDRIVRDIEDILEKGQLYKKQNLLFSRIKTMVGIGNVSEKVAEFLLKEIKVLC